MGGLRTSDNTDMACADYQTLQVAGLEQTPPACIGKPFPCFKLPLWLAQQELKQQELARRRAEEDRAAARLHKAALPVSVLLLGAAGKSQGHDLCSIAAEAGVQRARRTLTWWRLVAGQEAAGPSRPKVADFFAKAEATLLAPVKAAAAELVSKGTTSEVGSTLERQSRICW